MRTIFLILTTLFFCFAKAQISNKTKAIIKPLKNYQSFYALDNEPDSIEKKLAENSTAEELYYLSNHGKNPYIKSIAFKILAQKNDSRLSEVFKKSINSKEQLNYRTECLSHSQLLAGYFFEVIIGESLLSEDEKERLKKEMMELIFNSNPVNTKLLEELHYQIPVADNAYSKLRKQVIESRSSELLMELANYKNPDDIDLIKSFGEDSFSAIEQFPDKKFLPFLEDNIQHSSSFPFMFALASYCDDEAKLIIEQAIARKKTEAANMDCGNNCLTTIYQQIYKNKCELYYPTLAKMWTTDKVISFEIFDY